MNAALQEHLPRSWARTSIVLVIVGVAAAWLAHGHGARSRKERAPAPITESSAPKAALEPVVARQKLDLEATIMQRLHAIGEADPAAALALAFEGNARFPASADAPERGWIICRSLVELRRFPEAVAEARLVVDRYPDTPWALDVERHLLVNPMSDPSERGHGHEFELE